MIAPEVRLCRVVAGFGLPGAVLTLPEVPLDERAWGSLLALVKDQRLTGLLAAAAVEGPMPITAAQFEELARAHRWWMGVALTLERLLSRTIDQLLGEGIAYKVLKGSAVAHLDYPDPALRSFGDVDLLVHSDQFDDAVELLARTGGKRRYPQPRPGFDRRFGKGSCVVTADRLEIDLHRSFAMGPFGLTIRLEDLWSRSSTFLLAGQEVQTLAPEERFLHACYHAALGDPVPRLGALRDVAQMLLCRPLDLDLVRERSDAWQADAVLARAVSVAAATLEVGAEHPLVEWARRYRASRRDQRRLSVYLDPHQSYAAKSFAGLRAVPGVRDKLAYAAALAFPADSYVEQRHPGRHQRWARGISQIVHGRGER